MFDVFRPVAPGGAASEAHNGATSARPESRPPLDIDSDCEPPSTSGTHLKKCELCPRVAQIHCDADSAHLCSGCDVKVHTANFLVSRHVRVLLCSICQAETTWRACGGRPNKEHHKCKQCEAQAKRLTMEEDQCVPSDSKWLSLGPVLAEEQLHSEPACRAAETAGPGAGPYRQWGANSVQEVHGQAFRAQSPSGSSAVSGLSEERGATVTPDSVLSYASLEGRKRRAPEGEGARIVSRKVQRVSFGLACYSRLTLHSFHCHCFVVSFPGLLAKSPGGFLGDLREAGFETSHTLFLSDNCLSSRCIPRCQMAS